MGSVHTRRPYARLPLCPYAPMPACPHARMPAYTRPTGTITSSIPSGPGNT